MARVLCIDCEPETVAGLKGAGHSAVSVELGYRTGKRNFVAPPHEYDLMVCDLKKPACFDSTDWGPYGKNDNTRCELVEAVSNVAYLRNGQLHYMHRLIQEGQLPPVIPGTFGPDDVLRAIKDGGIPFFLFLNDEWVKRIGWFPNFFNLSWTFKRTIATRIAVDRILIDRLSELGANIRIAIPLQNVISEGPRPRISRERVSFTSFPLVTNSVRDVFGQLVVIGSGNIWLLPTLEDNVLAITRIASNLSAFRSAVVVSAAVKAATPAPSGFQAPVAAEVASPKAGPDNRTIFVIHGRDERLRAGMFDFLRSLDLKPLEWTEAIKLTGKASPYIGEILDAAFSRAQAVVVLLTPDDEARLRDALRGVAEPAYETQLTPQARPNVLFEAGMAMARDPDRTILVQVGDVRPFSDIAGRHMIRMDNSTKKRQDLALRLEAAGCGVNLKGTDWQTTGDLTPPSISPAAHSTREPPSAQAGSEQTSPNIIHTSIYRCRLVQNEETDVWTAEGVGYEGIGLQFSNDPRPKSKNIGAFVRAQIIYLTKDGVERARITGCWLNDAYSAVEFRVGDSHDLVVGMMVQSQFCVLENRRQDAARYDEDVTQIRPVSDFQAGTIQVRLINADTGTIIYDGQFELRTDPFDVVARVVASG